LASNFLKPNEIEDWFTNNIVSILLEDKKLQQFSDYILNTYIKSVCDQPLSVWAMYLYSIIRTTNNCEAFSFKFNSMFNLAHLYIFQFLDVLKNVHKETYIKQRSICLTKNRPVIVYKKEDYLR
jgi:hypothetical protein